MKLASKKLSTGIMVLIIGLPIAVVLTIASILIVRWWK